MIEDVLNLFSDDNVSQFLTIKDVFDFSSGDEFPQFPVMSDAVCDAFYDSFLFEITITDNFCAVYGKYTYYELLEKFEDLSKIVDNFLPDYFTLRYLEKEAILDRASIARLAVALSNLFRLCIENEVDELHLASLRIRKLYYDKLNKYFFVITDY